MDKNRINDRIIGTDKVMETLLYINAKNYSSQNYVDNNKLKKYGLLETAEKLVSDNILGDTCIGPEQKSVDRTFYLRLPGIRLVEEFLVSQTNIPIKEVSVDSVYQN